MRKIAITEVEEILANNGLTLYEGEQYTGVDTPIKCLDKMGFTVYSTIWRIKIGNSPTIFGNGNPFTIQNIEHYLSLYAEKAKGFCLVSEEFGRFNEPLIFKCGLHGDFRMSWNKFQQGERCPKCSAINSANTLRKSSENFKQEVNELVGDEYTILEKYQTARLKILIRHNVCGYEWLIRPYSFLMGQRCIKCYRSMNIGENHPRYNANKADDERLKGRYQLYGKNMVKWRQAIFNRDDYTCQCCEKRGAGELNAHHLDSWNWAFDKRFATQNGITLCRDCHKEFHGIYGKGNNTVDQFNEFKDLKLSTHKGAFLTTKRW